MEQDFGKLSKLVSVFNIRIVTYIKYVIDINAELKFTYLSKVEKGRRFEPYQGSFNESPAFPSYPPISNLYFSFSLPSLNSEY